MELFFYTISFYHLFYHLCKSTVVRNMLEAVKTIKHHKMRKKKAVEQITKIYDHYIKIESNIYNMRTFTMLQRAIKYKGIRPSYVNIFIEKSKMDIYRNVNSGNSELCPTQAM